MISGRILTLSVQAGVYLVVAVLLGRAWKLLGRAGVYLVGGGVVHAEVQKKQWNPGCLEEFLKLYGVVMKSRRTRQVKNL